MALTGMWNMQYVYYEGATCNNATMNIETENPLTGWCLINGTEVPISSGQVVNACNGSWLWFMCQEPNTNEQYFFAGCYSPNADTMSGGSVIPVSSSSKKRSHNGSDHDGDDHDRDDSSLIDPADMAGWTASHN
ncbi:MAG TPA: hypothetical protein VEZ90_05750 [Blastocatellia bacterium]|nr:hypothetical protein [Blastocatellia bacterium]